MKKLLLELKRKEVDIQIVNGELQVGLPDGFEDSDLLIEVKKNKANIIDYFNKRKIINSDWNKIPCAAVKEYYPASHQQQRLFVLHQLSPDSLAYNMPQAFRIERSSIDLIRLERSLTGLIERHEVLRTSFRIVDKKVVQTISRGYRVEMEKYKADEKDINTIASGFVRPFDLENGSLIRFGLIEVEDRYAILLLDIHHIIFDGISQQLLVQEFEMLYNGEILPALEIHYKDYSVWFQGLDKDLIFQQKNFWMTEFATLPKSCELPTDFKRPEKKDYRGDTIYFSLGKELTAQLNNLAKRADTSMFTVLFSAYGMLISRLSNQDDIVIGTPTSGRTYPALNDVMGLFVNTLPIRFVLDTRLSYRSYLDDLNFKILSCFDHQLYPIDKLIDDLELSRTLTSNPLFDAFFVLQNIGKKVNSTKKLEIYPYKLDSHQTSKFDISLAAEEFEGDLNFNFEFSSQLFKAPTVERFVRYFKKILSSIADDENILLSEIDIISQDEQEFLLNINDNLKVEFPQQQNIVSLFEKQVQLVPDKIAIKANGIQFTYQELNQRANALARVLIRQGCSSSKLVGLLMGKSHETIIGMLAILKAGGAYMPIDIDYPVERIRFLLEDSRVGLVVTEKHYEDIVRNYCDCIFIDQLDLNKEDNSDPNLIIGPDDLCYVIYTSGTTGAPKGVMVEHRNVVRLLFNNSFQFDFRQDDIWTMFHSHCFDFSVWEMYGALLNGGKLVIIQKEDTLDPSSYLKILQEEKVTILNQTPTAFYNLIQEDIREKFVLSGLRYVIFGGEALTPSKLKKWYKNYPDVKLINMFGITETTVHVTYKEIDDLEIEQNISNIGKPIPTTSVYLFDKNRKLVPPGVIAELYVGGAGVSRGYLNNSGLTGERFVTNPYGDNDRLYRTGDLARMLPNGEIEYLGRADQQINLRGFRIEPGEIEFHLLQYSSIENAVVVIKSNEWGNEYLCAYFVSTETLSADSIREYLQQKIPSHTIPSYFIPIDQIPFTKNNKIDTSRLPDPGPVISANFVSPGNEAELKMSKIWSKELSSDKIGITDNFFSLGGDSLKAISLIYEINNQFQCNLRISDLYLNQTIEKLSRYLTVSLDTNGAAKSFAQEEIRLFQEKYREDTVWDDSYESVYPMNGIEKGMVFYSLKINGEAAGVHEILYHEQNIYDIPLKNFDFGVFKKAIDLLVDKHADLRKIYDLKHSAHIVKKQIAPELNYINLSGLNASEQEKFVIDKIESEKLKATQLDHSILWRMNILKMNDDFHILLFDMHHSLFDGWSLQSFITELNNTYATLQKDPLYQPQKLRCNYGDHILSELIESKDDTNLSYWRNELSGLNRLNFPRKNDSNRIEHKTIILGDDLKLKLEKLAEKFNTSFKHLCIAAYGYTMQLCSFEKDIAVGLITNNRPLVADGEKLLGCFLNSVPFRVNIPETLTWGEYIEFIEYKLQELKKHERMSFQEIIKLVEEPASSGNPLFDTCFNYTDFWILNQIQTLGEIENPKDLYLDRTQYRSYMNTNTLCDFHVSPNAGFKLHITYSSSYFDEQFIDMLLQHYLNTLIQFAEQTDDIISQERVFPKKEQHKLLYEFNDTAVSYPKDKTIMDLFEEQVIKTPDNVAVWCGDVSMTYKDLNEKSDRVAIYLQQEEGVKTGDLVGLLLDRQEEMFPAIFGIMKSGGVYVPLSTKHPSARINSIISNSGLKILITRRRHIDDLAIKMESGLLDLDISIESINSQLPGRAVGRAGGNDLAYVIYTSGSTGNPKGVMIEHHSVINRLMWMQRKYGLTEADVLLQKTPLIFDVSVWELFWWSFTGASVCLLPPDDEKDPAKVIGAIEQYKVTTIHFVPSMLDAFLDEVKGREDKKLNTLRQVFSSGEALKPEHVNSFGKILHNLYQTRLINLYGPTEATVDVSYYHCSFGHITGSVPIGRPIDNTKLYVVDKNGQLSPIGVPGELCIGGDGLARGYVNENGLTEEKFIPNLFETEGRIYRTGDLASWLPDGNIEFLGRIDDQVKIRGYRIELGEIESQLLSYNQIKQAVLTCFENANDKKLIAFVVPAENTILDLFEIKRFLKSRLPEYMIPSMIREVNTIPLTGSGKIDKKTLLKSIDKSLNEKITGLKPGTETERQVAKIWSDLLMINEISIDDNFFDLGGHSLLLIRSNAVIYDEYAVKLPFNLYFTGTLEQIAQEIEKNINQDTSTDNP